MFERKFLFFLMLCSFFNSYAVKVAFFKEYDRHGNLIQYEGPFSHVAISYGNRWLHAHPRFGVSLANSLYDIDLDFIILENKDIPEPRPDFVKEQLSKKFNLFGAWNNPFETYCSKLVANFFRIAPTKMRFKSKNWKGINYKSVQNSLGLSPTDIFQRLSVNLGFKYSEASLFYRKDPVSDRIRVRKCKTYL